MRFFPAAIASLAIFSSLIAEYILGIPPCRFCSQQRTCWLLFLVCNLLAPNNLSFPLGFLILAVGIVLSLWHDAIQNGLVPDVCRAAAVGSDIDGFLLSLREKDSRSCAVVGWGPLGISSSIWNLFAGGLTVYFHLRNKPRKAPNSIIRTDLRGLI